MKNRRLMLLAMLFTLVGSTLVGRAYADNLSVGTVKMGPGETKLLEINLVNPDKQYTAFQFDLQLPKGISIVKNDNGNFVASLNDSRKDDHSFAVSALANNTYRFLAYSLSNAVFTGSSGALVSVSISSDPALKDGDVVATIKEQVFTDAASNQYDLEDVTFDMTIATPVPVITLNKTKAIIEKGKTLTLKAKVSPTTIDQSVTWKSSDKTVATVTKAGKVKAVGVGTAKITCTSVATGAKATCKVTVGYVKLSKTEVTIEKGKTMTMKSKVYPTTVKDQSVTWKSSDPKIVKVTSSGKIGGLKVGMATITCTSNATGLSATCEVTVGYVKLSASKLTIQKGEITKLKYKVYPMDLADQSVTWKSSDPTIVKVTASGKIGGMKPGTANITCTSNATGLSATCTVTVVDPAGARSLGGDDGELTDIEEIQSAVTEPFDVYDLSGCKIRHQVTSLDGLPNGVYIVNGEKVLKK